MGQHHELQQSQLDVKPALDRAQARNKEEIDRKRKAFVGGLPRNLPDHDLQDYFQQFGPIQKCYVVKDPNTGKTRGFGFVIFGNEEGFQAALSKTDHIIKGKEVHLKSAMSKYDAPAESSSTKGSTSKSKHPPIHSSQYPEAKKTSKHKAYPPQQSTSRSHKSKFNQQAKVEHDAHQSSHSYWNQAYDGKDFYPYDQFNGYDHPYDYENNHYQQEYDFHEQPRWDGYGYTQDYWNQEFEYPATDSYDYQNEGFQHNLSPPQPGPIGGQRHHSNGKAINVYKEEPLADGKKPSQGYSLPQNTPLIPVQKLHSNSLSDRELYLYHAQSAKLAHPKHAMLAGLNQQSSMQDVYFQRESGLKNDAAFTPGSAANLISKQAPRSAQAIQLSSHDFLGNPGSAGNDRSAPTYTQNPFEEEEEAALQRAEDIYG
jgi:hypothetical protein